MLEAPFSLLDATFAAMRRCGGGRRECVAYWLGPAADPSQVSCLVQPPHGAGRCWYEVEDQWLTEFFLDLRRTRQSVRAQLHTHPGASVAHSQTDDTYPIASTPGTLSIVIPYFATRQPTLDDASVVELTSTGTWIDRVATDVITWT